MKKSGLFKVLLALLLLVVLGSWLIKASVFDSSTKELLFLADYATMYEMDIYSAVKIGFFDIFQLLFATVMYFSQPFIFILSVGAFYGVLSKTGKYRAWVDKIALKFKGKEKSLLITFTCLIAIISAVTNYGLLFLIFIPFIIGVVIAMGYDKVTAFLTTFGAVIIGELGSLFGSNVTGQINEALGVTDVKTGLIYRAILLFIGLAFLIFYILKNKPNKNETVKNLDSFVGEKNSNKYSVVPIIVFFCIIFVLLVLGCTNWTEFNINFFKLFHQKLINNDFISKLLGTYNGIMIAGTTNASDQVAISALGTWNYIEMSIVLILSSLLIARFYRISHKDALDNMIDGVKKMLVPALLVLFAYTIFLASQFYYPTIANFVLTITKGFNVIFSSLTMALGTLFNIDILYISSNAIRQIAAHGGKVTLLMVMSQAIYGFVTLVSPTSILLLVGLSYLELPYCEYVKKIWKYLAILLATLIALLLILNFVL